MLLNYYLFVWWNNVWAVLVRVFLVQFRIVCAYNFIHSIAHMHAQRVQKAGLEFIRISFDKSSKKTDREIRETKRDKVSAAI